MTPTDWEVVKTVAMVIKTGAMFLSLVVLIWWSRSARYNSPLEVKHRAFLAKMARYDEEDRAGDLALQKFKDNPHAD